jgi:hypothetical protein
MTDARVMAAQVTWILSGWDLKVHAFPSLGEVTSEAVCTHSALTARLVEPRGDEPKCFGCLLIFGDKLATQQGDAAWR